ncbi:thrombospondin, type I, domain containing 7Ab isoform X4 [Denticeps clupeoides]|uniref:thrombospondin, type I, domain containing 7Ab isoform X4 n=1 Tax=Denticeps clupeoides TaxID=299321 RepID=UPI0010A40139|nr:thrombospondin type-1 domain-containing protein 7A-like isoform X4 [Denticeps clupeoides]
MGRNDIFLLRAMGLMAESGRRTGSSSSSSRTGSGVLSLWKLVLLLAVMWTVRTQTPEDSKPMYFWETGPWGRCMGSECGPGGSQSRAVWCAHVEGWTTLHTNCQQFGRPANQQNCFRVCDWHKDLYDWQLGQWNQCVPVSLRTGAARPAMCSQGEEGIQTREVRCVLKASGAPSDDAICEYFEPKPRLEQACLIPCPQDCIVSQFTPWTSCSKTCGTGLQNRVRSVLLPPLFGGSACPNLTEFQTCKPGPCEGRDSVFSLRMGGWSNCTLPVARPTRQARRRKGGIKDPETRKLIKSKRNRNRLNRQESNLWDIQVGYQARQVTCVHRNGSTAALSLCPHWSLPTMFQSCLMPKDCVTSEWAGWSACSKSCLDPNLPEGTRTRSRQVQQFPTAGGAECPALEETEPCEPQGDGSPPCATYSWRTTEWTDCRVDVLLSQQDRRRSNQTGLCGGGLQTREVFCVQANAELLAYLSNMKDSAELQSQSRQTPSVPPLLSISYEITASRPVPAQLCIALVPETSQLCHIPCPIECEVSPWAAWGPCTFENCNDQTGKKGFKLRKREITNYPTGGVGSCPHLVEAIPCDDPSCYNWKLLKFEDCVPDNQMKCGAGTQVPLVLCINSDGETVDKKLCRDTLLPLPAACEVPCPRDCTISPWTAWTSCSQTCSSKTVEGKQMRTRSILAYNAGEVTSMVVAWITVMEGLTQLPKFPPLLGGVLCPNSSMLQEMRSCNENPCTVYHWQTGPWGPCMEEPSAAGSNASTRVSCSMGVQTRKVICVRVNVGQVPPKKCPESPRPETMRPCLLPCKKDCIVTPFSEWSECLANCESGGSIPTNKQSRKRIVIQMPSNGGQECPEVVNEERDCESPAVCPGYRWKTHKWRRCQLVPWHIRQDSPGSQETCGPGLQTRAVSCRQLDGTMVDVTQCLKFASSMPPITQLCQLPCQDDCQLTNWSKFSPCTSDCVGVRTRRRALVGKSKKRDKCKNSQLFPLSETQYCPCDKYNAQPVGNWSDCILPEDRSAESPVGMKVLGEAKACGQGYRYQAMVCYDQDNRLVETLRCNSHGYIEEACIIACPSDCKLSEWSNWSRCSKSCGSGVKVRSKWLREKPYNGGRPCPKLDHINQAQVYEVVPCVSDCSQYVWVAEPWSMWKVSSVDLKENCGEGVQTRKVRCMLNTVDGPSDAVEDYLCDPEEMPLGTREYRLPCPEDCVLSVWSSWTRCRMPCDGRADRERTAYAIRLPSGGRQCPETKQTEVCLLNKNCYHYSYNITDWSTCQLSSNAVCGSGLKTRMLDCVRSDGKSVDLKYCEELGLEKRWHMNASCTVECPVNCQLSDWSTWTECSHACGLEGRMWRTRTVIRASQGDGRPCPSQMEQWKPCPVRPCYRWQYSPWSECRVEEVVCGEGRRFRNVSCFVSDGLREDQGSMVEEELCAGLELAVDGDKRIILEAPCTLPCPGDCYLMEWSDWSPCQSVCVKGERLDFAPVQARSRAVIAQEPQNLLQCPDQEWESQPCADGECFEYRWMSADTGYADLVWCQRSDGINVTGGCPPLSQPGLDQSCDVPCDKPKSFCSEAGLCLCEEGYTEVLTPEGLLDQCTPIPVLEIPTAGDKKADVKTSRAIDPTLPTTAQPGRTGRIWYLQPFGPDGRLKTWVYGVAAGVLVLLVFVVSMIYIACKKPKKPQRRQNNNRLKPLTLAYDGDADM